jgi:hypothetical protein
MQEIKEKKRKTKKLGFRERYLKNHEIVRAWIFKELKEWLESGRFGQSIKQSSIILCQFLNSDECFRAYNAWLLTRPDLNKE